MLLFRVFNGTRHVGSAAEPEVAAQIANMYGAGSTVHYRGHCLAQLDVNGQDCTKVVIDGQAEVDAEHPIA